MVNLKDILQSMPELKSFSKEEISEYSDEINQLIQKNSDLVAIRKEYENIFSKEKDLSVDVEMLRGRLFPSIYFGTAKHHRTKLPFIVARSLWKKGLNDYAQLSVYVGPVSKFKNGIEDEEVKKIALEKMRKKIKEKFPMED